MLTQKAEINDHFATVHKGKKPFKCDFCGYNAPRNGRLHKETFCIIPCSPGMKEAIQMSIFLSFFRQPL